MAKHQKGFVPPHLLLVLAALGLITYLLVSASAPFKDKLFSILYPKPVSKAEGSAFPCQRPNQIQIGQENPGYTCQADVNGCVKTPYARYIYTTDGDGDGVSDPQNQYDQPWCDNNCVDPIKYCGGGGDGGGGGGSGCSGNACTDCILDNRGDILSFYQSNGWDISCGNQTNVVNNWCGIDPTGCNDLKTTTCSSQCGYAPPPTPAPLPVNCTPGDACGSCNAKTCSDGTVCATGHSYCVYDGVGNHCGGCITEVDNCATQCAPAATPAPVNCNPGDTCGSCNAQTCSDGTVCATGHSYCVYDGAGNHCGGCNIEVDNCSTQCETPATPPSATPPPASGCTPGTTCGSCNAQTCSDGTVCATGHSYCIYDPGGNYCGSCTIEVDNCSTQCAVASDPCPGQHDVTGACNTGCCSNSSQCPSGEKCNLSNGYCQSGKSCNPKSGSDPAPTPTPTPPPAACPGETCSYTTSDSACASGLKICSGSGTSGFNQPGCIFTEGCSSCTCYNPEPVPAPAEKKQTCDGRYSMSLLNSNPLKTNFGDPNCDFDKYGLYDYLQANDFKNADRWMAVAYCESTFVANAYNRFSVASGAWGLFQMGGWNSAQKNSADGGLYDRGDVVWKQQAYNAIMYSKLQIGGSFRYWACGNETYWPK